jgi:hypothetical protein
LDDDDGELNPEVERRLQAPDRADLAWVRERTIAVTKARRAAGGGCGDTLYGRVSFLKRVIGSEIGKSCQRG